MARVQYKQRCAKCKKNYVLSSSGQQSYVLCYDCQKPAMKGEITDPYYKKLFDIPEEYYKVNGFLRNIKVFYLKNKGINPKQEDTFRKVVAKMNAEK